jgi:hypothetical protein
MVTVSKGPIDKAFGVETIGGKKIQFWPMGSFEKG